MKKIRTLTTLAMAALVLAACDQAREVERVTIPGKQITVSATRDASTRSSLEVTADASGAPSYTVLWDAPDQIYVSYAGSEPGIFKSDNTTRATEADFTGHLNDPVGDDTVLYGIYPAESGNSVSADGMFSIVYHSEQTAVEGSFDASAFPAVAVSGAGSTNLQFYNVCGLLVLSVEYDDVTKISVESLSSDPASLDTEPHIPGGTLSVSLDDTDGPVIKDCTEVLETISFLPPSGEEYFTSGKAYYLPVPPCTLPNGVNFMVTRSGTDYPFIIRSEVSVGRSKVHEVPAFSGIAVPSEKTPSLELVWALESDDTALWTGQITSVSVTHPDGYGMVRSIAMDDDYIYLPKSSAYANIAAVSIADPTVQTKADVSTITGGGTFATSCARMIKNTDASVNGGKDILLVSNLTEATSSTALTVYAYTNGITAAPVVLCKFAWDSANETEDWRRYGDRFFVTGTWQEGKLYFPSFNPGKSVILSVANGERTGVTQIWAGDYSPSGIKNIVVYPGSDNILLHNASFANIVTPSGGFYNGWNEYSLYQEAAFYKGVWGVNFFSFDGADYIADTLLSDEPYACVEVYPDKGSLEDSGDDDSEGYTSSDLNPGTDSSFADCCVRVIDGVPYIAAMVQNGGLYLYKLTLALSDVLPLGDDVVKTKAGSAPASRHHR